MLASAFGLVLVLGVLIEMRGRWSRLESTGSPLRQSSETETPTPASEPTLDPADVYHPILTSADAVTRTLQELPDSVIPQQTVVRLVAEGHFRAWA